MIIKSKKLAYDSNGNIVPRFITKCIEEHLKDTDRLQKLYNYYIGKQSILNRKKSSEFVANNKGVYNHAKNIIDTSVGYVFGQPIQYNNLPEEVEQLFILEDEDSHNVTIGTDMAIYGRAVELLYLSNDLTDKTLPYVVRLNPINSFVVYDTDLKNTPIMGITYSENRDIEDNFINYTIIVYTTDYTYNFSTIDLKAGTLTLQDIEINQFGCIPILEVYNNEFEQGDFEPVIGLLDAYNILMNDRLNDKEQLADAILVIKGICLGDNDEEVSTTKNWIRDNGLLAFEDNEASAEYITKTFNETDIEILKKAIITDIHKITHIPDMSDENFVGNSSGIAMAYKILGFEQLGINKERAFKQLLRKRLIVMAQSPTMTFNVADVDIKMSRTLPVDKSFKLDELQRTEGILSLETRLKNYDPELDVTEELKRIQAEKELEARTMANAYNTLQFPNNNKPIEEDMSNNKDE